MRSRKLPLNSTRFSEFLGGTQTPLDDSSVPHCHRQFKDPAEFPRVQTRELQLSAGKMALIRIRVHVMSDFWNVFYRALIGVKTTRFQGQTRLGIPELTKVNHTLLLCELTGFYHGDVRRSPPARERPIEVPLSGGWAWGNIKWEG